MCTKMVRGFGPFPVELMLAQDNMYATTLDEYVADTYSAPRTITLEVGPMGTRGAFDDHLWAAAGWCRIHSRY